MPCAALKTAVSLPEGSSPASRHDVRLVASWSPLIVISPAHTHARSLLHAAAVFPADRRLWTSARRLKSTRPATDGRFSFGDLAPGEYLLAAATDLDPDKWQSTESLEEFAGAAVRLTLGEGERKVQDLRLAR
jgi:hypothetical protein